MNKETFLKAIKQLDAGNRKFKQSYELIINLRDLDLKKPDNHVDLFTRLPNGRGKKIKVCALVGGELSEQAKKNCDHVVMQRDFAKFEGDKKAIKKLARDYDYFIAQANLMGKVAKTFGRVFGPRNKMPNPKAGCVVPPNANLETVMEKLRDMVRLTAKTQASIKAHVGTQDQSEEQVAANMASAYTAAARALPHEANNIKSVIIKLTMSKPVRVGSKEVQA